MKPPPVQQDQVAAVSASARLSFDGKVDALTAIGNEVRRTGVAKSVELSFSEDEILSRAADNIAGDANAAEIEIHLLNNSIVAKSRSVVDGVTYTTSLLARPQIVAGATRFVLTSFNQSAYRGTVHLGSTVAAPAIVATMTIPAAIQDRMAKTLDPANLGLPLEVTDLAVVDGQLVVEGIVRP